jgi:hypothetical protein
MKQNDICKTEVNLSLSYEEVYILLQCVAEMRDTRTDADIEAITGVDRSRLVSIAKELNNLKNAMFGADER